MTLKRLLKKYNKYIDGYELDEEHTDREGVPNYWVYLKDGYETDWGETCQMDTLDQLDYFLQSVKQKYES